MDITDAVAAAGNAANPPAGSNIVGDAVNQAGAFVDQIVQNLELEKLLPNITLIAMLISSLSKNKPFPKTKLAFRGTYDYIIVGGGSAGSVMANRLSEIPCIRILLLEAGAEAPLLTEIPSFARLFYGSSIDWKYETVPQKHCAYGQKDNKVILNSGKVLGGTSVINAMLYVRGNKKNYDDWEADGATGWSYEDVLPFFKLSENNQNIDEVDPGYHGTDGPLTVEKPLYEPEIKQPILKATTDMGYEVRDINGMNQTGIYDLQGTLRFQERCSTAKAYLVPAEDRPNLDIIKNAFARKILIDENKRAYGVEFEYLGRIRRVRATEEVIISTGTLRTPQILMLSGIGPCDHLNELNIECIQNLPVGKNLQDHYAVQMAYELSPTIPNVLLKNLNPLNIVQYITSRKGPLTSPNQVTVMGFLDGSNTTSTFPRQENYWAEYTTLDALLNSNLKPEVYSEVYGGKELKSSYVCFTSILQPYSRGEVTLKSTNPHDYPNIDPNYYADDRDLDDMVEGMKFCDAVARSKPLKSVLSTTLTGTYPNCKNVADGNDTEYFKCQAKQVVNTFWHLVGTARMGDPKDPRSVVDPQLKVIGISRLRVVNAAVMPTVPSGNTNVPTIMIAEKIAYEMKKNISCSLNRSALRRARWSSIF